MVRELVGSRVNTPTSFVDLYNLDIAISMTSNQLFSAPRSLLMWMENQGVKSLKMIGNDIVRGKVVQCFSS
jgi:hypothetical protein